MAVETWIVGITLCVGGGKVGCGPMLADIGKAGRLWQPTTTKEIMSDPTALNIKSLKVAPMQTCN
jgi:hypothetical protein